MAKAAWRLVSLAGGGQSLFVQTDRVYGWLWPAFELPPGVQNGGFPNGGHVHT